MKVKVCGITTPRDLRLVDAAGADYAGIVLAPGSARVVTLERLAELAHVPVRLKRVGVFVRATPSQIVKAVRIGHLDVVQLYHCTFRRAGVEVWKATPGLGRASAVVFDAVPGAGRVGNWSAAARLARIRCTVLAGGLTPDNVSAAVAAVRPWCIDGASGTERFPGVKDPEKVYAFIRKAKQ